MPVTALPTIPARSRASAREVERIRDEFLTIASHELRTPLTPLQLQLQMLAQQAPALARDPAAAEWLAARVATLQRQSDRLTRLVNELLDVSRLLEAPPRLERRRVDLGREVNRVLDELERSGRIARSGCTLARRIAPGAIGAWDPRRIAQIASHLIDNALKFGAGGEVQVTVTCEDAAVELSVTDHGIGIASVDHARIFERFERAVSTRHYGGFGLGLFVVRRAVEALGGSVSVVSQLGRGATFRVRLPRQAPSRPAG